MIVEERGFEPSVPLVTDSLFLSEKKGPVVDQGGLETRRPFLGRTEGSNLVSSGGESLSPVSSVAAGAKARRSPGV